MAGYTRQDTANNISNGSVIDADDLDSEFNTIESAFNTTTGHAHDGSPGEGPAISKVGPLQDVVVSSTQVLPKTTNTLDLGSPAVQFKDAYFDGIVDTDLLTVSGNTTVGGTLGVTGVLTASAGITGDVTGTVSDVSNHDTGDIAEGSNLYYTNTRATAAAKAAISVLDAGGDGSLSYSNGVFTYTGPSATEVRAHFGAGTGVTYSSGQFSIGQAVGTSSNVTFNSVTASLTGNASTATRLATSRTLALTGDVTGSASFDGSANASITATVADNSHNHTISNITGLQTEIDTKAEKAGSASQAFAASTLSATTVNATTVNPTTVNATTVNATTVDLGDWTLTESAGTLYFATAGVNKMKLDASGNLTVTGNVDTNGTI